MQPVYLRFLLRTEQGTVRCRNDLHQYASLDYSFVSPLITSNNEQNDAKIVDKQPINIVGPYTSSPVICVTDTDFNLNVCLCETYDLEQPDSAGQTVMCAECGKFRIANDGILLRSRGFDGYSRDYIVNAIDTQLLYTLDHRYPQDPYTPESLESHSPETEYTPDQESRVSDELKQDEVKNSKLDVTANNKTKAVSPDQLKSRLESILRTTTDINDCDAQMRMITNDKEEEIGKQQIGKSTEKCCQCDVI